MYRSHGGLSKAGVKVDMATLTLNTGQGQNFEGAKRLTKLEKYIPITAAKKVIKYRKKKGFDCMAKNVGCMRNSEKKAPKDPQFY